MTRRSRMERRRLGMAIDDRKQEHGGEMSADWIWLELEVNVGYYGVAKAMNLGGLIACSSANACLVDV
jgi:hypothetical protein